MTLIGLHVILLRKCISFLILPNAAALCSTKIFRPPLNTQSAVIGQHTHTCARTAKVNRAVVLNQLSCAKLAAVRKLCKCLTW